MAGYECFRSFVYGAPFRRTFVLVDGAVDDLERGGASVQQRDRFWRQPERSGKSLHDAACRWDRPDDLHGYWLHGRPRTLRQRAILQRPAVGGASGQSTWSRATCAKQWLSATVDGN